MKKQIYVASMLSAAMFLAACDGDDGANGTNGTNGASGFNSLVAVRDIPKGDAVCLGGGTALDSGLDANRNDVLDAGEVTSTEILECEATPTVRALHASPDAPAVNIIVNGATALTGVDYSQGSGFVPVVEQNNIQVEAITPAGNAIVIDADIALDYNTEASILAVGTVDPADDGLGVFALPIINPSDSLITPGFFRAQIVHGSPSAPPVNVYVTALSDDLSMASPVNGVGTPLSFEDFTGQLEVPEGDYQIRIVADGDATLTPVFDSGEISLAAGADLMIVAIANTGPGTSAVDLVVLDGTAATKIEDVATPASAIAVHLSPDAPAVDILADVNSTPDVDESLPLVRNVAFGEFCDLNAVPAPGDYTISVAANADNSIVAAQFPLVVDPGTEVTAIVSGFLDLNMAGLTPAITALPQVDDRRSVFTETKLRVTHGSPSTGPVDIYLVPAGTVIDNTIAPAFEDVPFGADTGQLSIASGIYDAVVTGADSTTPAIELLGLDFTTGGSVLNVIARDLAAGGLDSTPLIIDMTNVPVCP